MSYPVKLLEIQYLENGMLSEFSASGNPDLIYCYKIPGNLITYENIFENCSGLLSAGINELQNNNLSFNNFCKNCYSLTSVVIDNAFSDSIVSMDSIFENCLSLVSLPTIIQQ